MFAKSTKILLAALVLAATSLTVAANARPTPSQSGWSQGGFDESYMRERHDPTNTNGN